MKAPFFFDRLLIAQSQIEKLPLLTADPQLLPYDLEIVWAGRRQPSRRKARKGQTDAVLLSMH